MCGDQQGVKAEQKENGAVHRIRVGIDFTQRLGALDLSSNQDNDGMVLSTFGDWTRR